MNISYRIKNGWKAGTQEKSNICNKCFSNLWIAPDGQSIYCDNTHNIINGEIEKTFKTDLKTIKNLAFEVIKEHNKKGVEK